MNSPQCYALNHYAHGQPTPEQLGELSALGVRTVINLRAPEEAIGFDEAGVAADLGLNYVTLPIAGAPDLDRARVTQFGEVLEEARRHGGVLIHCASSNRVGAMVALDEAFNRGASVEDALAHGRAAGLTALEPVVAALLEADRAP